MLIIQQANDVKRCVFILKNHHASSGYIKFNYICHTRITWIYYLVYSRIPVDNDMMISSNSKKATLAFSLNARKKMNKKKRLETNNKIDVDMLLPMPCP